MAEWLVACPLIEWIMAFPLEWKYILAFLVGFITFTLILR